MNEISSTNYTGGVYEFPLHNFFLTLAYGTGNITSADTDSEPNSNSGEREGKGEMKAGKVVIEEKAGTTDHFTHFLASYNSTLPMDKLVGRENARNLVEATKALYKIYMPQAISRNMRSNNMTLSTSTSTTDNPAPEKKKEEDTIMPPQPPTFTTQASSSSSSDLYQTLRLKQESVPKLTIQILLSIIILCILTARAFLLRGIEKVIPHSPCSIAGRASLFADGEVGTRRLVPVGAEWANERDRDRDRERRRGRREEGVYEGWLFSLGWWESEGVYKYGVDIGWIDRGGCGESNKGAVG